MLLAPGIWSAGVVAKETNKPDPQIVVVDEVIGQWITLAGAATFNWKTWLAAFVLFRLLDMWKPAPARQLEEFARRLGHRRRRRDGGSLRRACYIRIRSFSSFYFMALKFSYGI